MGMLLLIAAAHASVVDSSPKDCPPPIGSVLRPRMRAPTFTANAVHHEELVKYNSADAKGKWLVLMFYPFDFTFVCPTEVRHLSTRSDGHVKAPSACHHQGCAA
jgi:hypothetical protein